MTTCSATQLALVTGEAGIEGAGPGLASVEAWAIALLALAILFVATRWATTRRRAREPADDKERPAITEQAVRRRPVPDTEGSP